MAKREISPPEPKPVAATPVAAISAGFICSSSRLAHVAKGRPFARDALKNSNALKLQTPGASKARSSWRENRSFLRLSVQVKNAPRFGSPVRPSPRLRGVDATGHARLSESLAAIGVKIGLRYRVYGAAPVPFSGAGPRLEPRRQRRRNPDRPAARHDGNFHARGHKTLVAAQNPLVHFDPGAADRRDFESPRRVGHPSGRPFGNRSSC